MSIWDWVLLAYGHPGVPEACLELQDRYGQNTSYLLWAVRAGARDPQLLARAAATAKAWDANALVVLRDVRRRLKTPLPPVDDRAREALREEVKAVELHAERLLLETLDAMSEGRGGASALGALTAASNAWGTPAPASALAALASALG